MKLLRYGPAGQEKPGLLDADGVIRDLSTTSSQSGMSPGVGMGHKPEPVDLRPGQSMRLGIDGLGERRQTVVSA